MLGVVDGIQGYILSLNGQDQMYTFGYEDFSGSQSQ